MLSRYCYRIFTVVLSPFSAHAQGNVLYDILDKKSPFYNSLRVRNTVGAIALEYVDIERENIRLR